MKRYGYVIAAAIVGLSVSGCMNPQGRPDYTASGALAGAATGAIIGSTARHPGPGSLVGAAVGAVAGGAIGHGMDQAQQAQDARLARAQQQARQTPPLSITDIESLTRAKVSDDLIINQIRNSGTVYHLSSAEIIDLKKSGVSEKVINYMINTPSQVQSTPTTESIAGPTAVEPVMVEPAPGYIWVNGGWIWLNDGWGWHHGYWHDWDGHRHGHWR